MASQAPQSSSRGFELGNVATNRVLFVLALLGVLLPLNALVAHTFTVLNSPSGPG